MKNKFGILGLLLMLGGTVLQYIGNAKDSQDMTAERLDMMFGKKEDSEENK